MITLNDFIALATDDYFKINIWSCNDEQEILHQVELIDIEKELYKAQKISLLFDEISSWDIDNDQLTINI